MALGALLRRPSEFQRHSSDEHSAWWKLLPLSLGAGAQVLVLLAMYRSWNGEAFAPGSLAAVLACAALLAVLPAPYWLRLVRCAEVDGGIAPAAAHAWMPVAPLLGTLLASCYWMGHCALAALGLGLAAQGLHGLPGGPFQGVPVFVLALPILAGPVVPGLRHWRDRLAAALALAALGSSVWLFVNGLPILSSHLALKGTALASDAFTRLGAWCAAMFLAGPSLSAWEAVLCLPSGRARRDGTAGRLALAALLSIAGVLILLVLAPADGSLPADKVAGFRLADAILAFSAGSLAFMLSRGAAVRAMPSILAVATGRGELSAIGWPPILVSGAAIAAFTLLRENAWLFAGAGLAYFIALACAAAVALAPVGRALGNSVQGARVQGAAAALVAAVLWLGCGLFGLQAWGIQAVLVGLVMVLGAGVFDLARGLGPAGAHGSIHAKLLAGMLMILALNGLGYLAAHQALRASDPLLTALIDDVFVAVALLTVLVGVALPAMIVHALTRAAEAAERLTDGAVSGLCEGIDALGRGELDGASVVVPVERLETPFRDEIGRIAASINTLQIDVQQAARGLDSARDKLRHSRAELFHQARHDSLTGLCNRRAFEDELGRLVDDRRQHGPGHALLYLDLDQFKIVNDTCGHDAGDELLRQVSLLLAAQMRTDDILSRLGGDEFGVILANCSRDNAIRIAEAMVVAVRELSFGWKDRVFRIGVSIGVVPFVGGATSLTEVLAAADKSCYYAKEQGRNRLHTYSPDDDEISRREGEMQWVSRIHEAMEQGRLCLYAQQIRPLGEEPACCAHHELLLRMVDVAGELVPPMAFIPAAERFGVMTLLDRWVVRSALERLGELVRADDLGTIGSLAINLSGASITDETFLEFVKEQFRLTRVPHGRVWFEITETSAIANLRGAKRFISELRALGCRFGLDDFGAGMSSFGYLRQLEVDFLKIDGSFVQGMADDPVDHAMVGAINRIGQLMGLETIAEFVEDARAIELLRELGVDMIQGNGVAAPVPFVRPAGVQRRPAAAIEDAHATG